MTPSEIEFRDYWLSRGKDAYAERQRDQKDLRGLNQNRPVTAFAQTSDWLIAYKGRTFWAEVKECENPTRFPFSNIRTVQLARSRMIVRAGGEYVFFIRANKALRWFAVPAQEIHRLLALGERSVMWKDLEDFVWRR